MGGLGTLCAPRRLQPRRTPKVTNSAGAAVFSMVDEDACNTFLYAAVCARKIAWSTRDMIIHDARMRGLDIRRRALLGATFRRGLDADTDEERPETPTPGARPKRSPPHAPSASGKQPQRRASLNGKRRR